MEMIKYPRFRWFVAVVYVIVVMSTAVALIGLAPLMAMVSETIGKNLGVTSGIVMVTFNLVLAITAIASGPLTDRFGVTLIWLVCLISLALGFLLMPALGGTSSGLLICRILMGAGTGPIMGSVSALAATWFPQNQRAILTGLLGFSVALGVSVGLMLTPKLAAITGNWQTAIAWEALFVIIGIILVIIVMVGPKPPVADVIMGAQEKLSEIGSAFSLAIRQPATWAAVIASFAQSWIFNGFNDLTPNFLGMDAPVGLGKGPQLAGALFVFVQFGFLVGAFLSGFIVEKMFKGRVRPVATIGFIISAIAMFLIRFDFVNSNNSILIVDFLVAGFFLAMVQSPILGFVAKSYPEHITGKVGGFVYGLSIFGGTAGVAVGSLLLHSTGQYYAGMTGLTITAVVGLVIVQLLNVPKIYSEENSSMPNL